MNKSDRGRYSVAVLSLLSLLIAAQVAVALNSWGGYHWARTSTEKFTLKLGDNVSGPWDPILATTSSDWTQSTVLNTAIVGGLSNPKNCRPTSGRVEVCNSRYGNNGWLGIAQIWLTGGVHITQGVTKVNDTYFNTATYNTTPWRNLVMCQEVGHTLGLAHQDENFNNANLNTCMDYTSNPETNQHPNGDDYLTLSTVYAHVDSFSSVDQTMPLPPAMTELDFEGPGQWGRLISESKNGRTSIYEADFGFGNKIVTAVIWADGEERGKGRDDH
jgi:hypothetical protein